MATASTLFCCVEAWHNIVHENFEQKWFIIIPDMLKNAPMFKRLDARIKGKSTSQGAGQDRAVAIRARDTARRGGPVPSGKGVVPPVSR